MRQHENALAFSNGTAKSMLYYFQLEKGAGHFCPQSMSTLNLTLLTDLYELTMMQGYFNNQTNEKVVFDVFYRKNPSGSAYAICAGLDQVIDYIKNQTFEKEDIDYLRSTGFFNEPFLEYLSTFKFTGDIYAIPEGRVYHQKSSEIFH